VGFLAIAPRSPHPVNWRFLPQPSAPAFPLSQLFSPIIFFNSFHLPPSYPRAPLTLPATMKPEINSSPAGNQPKPVRSFLWKTANPFSLQRIFQKIRNDRTGQRSAGGQLPAGSACQRSLSAEGRRNRPAPPTPPHTSGGFQPQPESTGFYPVVISGIETRVVPRRVGDAPGHGARVGGYRRAIFTLGTDT
jgi:hypothetical protein